MNSTFAATRSPRDFVAVISGLGPRPPVATHSNKANAEWFAESLQRRQEFLGGLAKIAWSEFGHILEAPPLPVITANIAAGREGRAIEILSDLLAAYDAELDAKLSNCPYFGRAEYVGEHECVFTYCDSSAKRHGILQSTLAIAQHEHHLVQTRERKLFDHDVHLPPKQRRIVSMLPSAAQSSVRIIQGTLVLAKEQEVATVSRDHGFGRVLRQAGAAVSKYGSRTVGGFAAGAAAAGIGAAIISAVQAAATVAVMAAADPAIVIGDLVISGWIEAEVES